MEYTTRQWRAEGDHVLTSDHRTMNLVAFPVEGPYALPYDERVAHAKLWAAAPDLLVAALTVLGTMQGHGVGCQFRDAGAACYCGYDALQAATERVA